VLVGSGAVSGSFSVTGGTGRYDGYTSSNVTASGLSGSVLSGGMLSFSVSATANGLSFTFAVTNASVTISGTSVFSGPAAVTLAGSSPDTGTFSASNSLTNISGGNMTVPFTVTLGHGTITGSMTFPETVLVSSGPVSASATITGGTGSYAGYTSSTLTASGTVTGSVLSGATLSFSISGAVNTGGGGTTTPVPTIASVTDGASYTANIAEGGFFTVWGTNLAPSVIGGTNFPRPTSLSGVTVTVTPTAGGTGTPVYLIYIGTSQINCVLPSTVPVGNYNVTVTSGGTTSSPVATQVVARKPALFTQDQSGTGLAVVFNYISQSESDVNRLTTGNYNGSLSFSGQAGTSLDRLGNRPRRLCGGG